MGIGRQVHAVPHHVLSRRLETSPVGMDQKPSVANFLDQIHVGLGGNGDGLVAFEPMGFDEASEKGAAFKQFAQLVDPSKGGVVALEDGRAGFAKDVVDVVDAALHNGLVMPRNALHLFLGQGWIGGVVHYMDGGARFDIETVFLAAFGHSGGGFGRFQHDAGIVFQDESDANEFVVGSDIPFFLDKDVLVPVWGELGIGSHGPPSIARQTLFNHQPNVLQLSEPTRLHLVNSFNLRISTR